jgi:hypothetical protein
MSTGEDRRTETPPKATLPPEYQLLVQEEIRKAVSRYVAGATALLGLIALLGLTSIYGLISQSMTSTLDTKLTTKLTAVDADIKAKLADAETKIDRTIIDDSARIEKSRDEVRAIANEAWKDTVTFKVTFGEEIKRAEALKLDLHRRFQESDTQLSESKKKLDQFDIDINQAIGRGVSKILAIPDFRKAVANQINSDGANAIARLEMLADGKSPLNGAWMINGKGAQPSYSLEICKDRFILVGHDCLWTFATYDKKTRKLTSDAIGTAGWLDNSIGEVSDDYKSIVWQGDVVKWTRP